MTRLLVNIQQEQNTIVPLRLRKGRVEEVGILPRPNAIGWSRLFMHLWTQAEKEVPDGDDNAIKKWVLEALQILSDYHINLHPDKINHLDVIAILKRFGKITKPFQPYDPNLKDEHDNSWFESHSQYGKYFENPGADDADPWWMKAIDFDEIKTTPIAVPIPKPLPSSPALLEHRIHKYYNGDLNVWVTGTNLRLSPDVMKLGASFKIGTSQLQKDFKRFLKLDYLSIRSRVSIAIVNINDVHHPQFIGWREKDEVYGVSTAKIISVYAIHQLKYELNVFLKEKTNTGTRYATIAALEIDMHAIWGSLNIEDKLPSIQQLFDLTGNPFPNAVDIRTDWKNVLNDISGAGSPPVGTNAKNNELIGLLGFDFINSLLIQSGLFDSSSNKGIWMNSGFGTSPRRNPYRKIDASETISTPNP